MENNKENTNIAPSGDYLRIMHGKATDCFANMRNCKKEAYADNSLIISRPAEGVDVVINNNTINIKGEYLQQNISIHKMLVVILNQYCINNDYKKRKINSINTKHNLNCVINLEDFYIACGYKYKNNDGSMNTNNIREIRRTIRRIARIISGISIEWKESDVKYSSRSIITGWDLTRKAMIFHLNDSFADYLDHCPQIIYPKVLFGLDEKYPNAYRIGYKLFCHYYQKNNMNKGKNNKLRVRTLLDVTNINYEEVIKKDKKHWKRRLADVFEKNMGILAMDSIVEWNYMNDGVFSDVYDFLDTMIMYKPNRSISINSLEVV